MVRAARDLGHLWKKKRVPFFIDNQAFQASAVKGWSHAGRLSEHIRHLFVLAISHECIFEFNWISTHHNIFADALSRPEPLASFLSLVESQADQLPKGTELSQIHGAGDVRGIEPPPDNISGWSTRA